MSDSFRSAARGVRKFTGLAAARSGAQVLAVAWFLIAARRMSPGDFGTLATGLAFFAILAGLGDLGMTRTLVRHVAADRRLLWHAYRRALAWRLAGGFVATIVVGAVVVGANRGIKPVILVLAGVIATTSGASELAYAGLRSVGKVGVEAVTLVAERLLFLVVAWWLVRQGRGPEAILLAYVLTNALTAIVTGGVVSRARAPGPAPPLPSFGDSEARRTAMSFALATVAPRISTAVLAAVAGSEAVATFSVAQRPVEAVALFVASAIAPALAILRANLAQGGARAVTSTTVALYFLVAVLVAPVVAWWAVRPEEVLGLLFGSTRYPDSGAVLRLMAVTALTWPIRVVTELNLLASDRASRLLVMTGTGVVVNLVAAVPLAGAMGPKGAALAVLASETAMTVLLVAFEREVLRSASWVALAVPLVLFVLTWQTLEVVPPSAALTIVSVGAWTCVGAVMGTQRLRRAQGMAAWA